VQVAAIGSFQGARSGWRMRAALIMGWTISDRAQYTCTHTHAHTDTHMHAALIMGWTSTDRAQYTCPHTHTHACSPHHGMDEYRQSNREFGAPGECTNTHIHKHIHARTRTHTRTKQMHACTHTHTGKKTTHLRTCAQSRRRPPGRPQTCPYCACSCAAP